jgi:hypothetical protein
MGSQIYRQEAGMTYYDQSVTADIIERLVMNRKWGMIKNYAPTLAAMRMLTGKMSKPHPMNKKLEFPYGNYNIVDDSLATALVFGGTSAFLASDYSSGGSAARIHFNKTDIHIPMDIVRVNHATTSSYVTVRLGDKISAGVYNIDSIVDTNLSDSSETFAADNAKTQTLMSSVNFGKGKRESLNMNPTMLFNYFQTHRETLGKTFEELSGSTLADTDLMDLAMKHIRELAKKFNLTINFQQYCALVAGSDGEYGIFGGFPHMFNPAQVGDSNDLSGAGKVYRYSKIQNVDAYGTNRVDDGSTFDPENFLEWSRQLAEFGSKDKLIFLSTKTMSKVRKAFADEVTLERGVYGAMDPGYANMFDMPSVNLDCRLHFLPDYCLDGTRMLVKDSTTAATNASNLQDWMVAVDPEYTSLVPGIIKNVGVDDLGMKPLPYDDVNAVRQEEMEVTGTFTLRCEDPRTGGYYSITGS